MTAQIVQLPNGKKAEFPANATQEQIKAALDEYMKQEAKDEPTETPIVQVLAEIIAAKKSEGDSVQSEFTKALKNLDATAHVQELCNLVDNLTTEMQDVRKAAKANTKEIVTAINELRDEIEKSRKATFTLSVDGDGKKTIRRE